MCSLGCVVLADKHDENETSNGEISCPTVALLKSLTNVIDTISPGVILQ